MRSKIGSGPRWGRSGGWLVALVLALSSLPGLVAPARAGGGQTFTVNSTLDPGAGGVCNATECSLREAIEAANASPGADEIRFNIAGTSPGAIAPTSSFPSITDTVTIDGYTEPDAVENTLPLATDGTNAVLMVVLDGSALASASGLTIQSTAPNSIIRGLVISDFPFGGINIDADNVAIEGNFVGTNAAGTADGGNGREGINVRTGASGVTIGGADPVQRNLSSNNREGIAVQGDGASATILGNLIGTNKSGTGDLGNDEEGIEIQSGAKNVTIGGTAAGAGNVIAFNTAEGILIRSGTGNRILSNSIFQNGELGIDLDADGVTTNDKRDPDRGANRLQNFPVLTSAVINGGNGTTQIKGKLNSTPNTKFTIELFVSPFSLVDFEGKTFLGRKTVTTDDKGNASFTLTVNQALTAGDLVTATATNKQKRDTSEFSAAVPVS